MLSWFCKLWNNLKATLNIKHIMKISIEVSRDFRKNVQLWKVVFWCKNVCRPQNMSNSVGAKQTTNYGTKFQKRFVRNLWKDSQKKFKTILTNAKKMHISLYLSVPHKPWLLKHVRIITILFVQQWGKMYI